MEYIVFRERLQEIMGRCVSLCTRQGQICVQLCAIKAHDLAPSSDPIPHLASLPPTSIAIRLPSPRLLLQLTFKLPITTTSLSRLNGKTYQKHH